MKIHPPRVDRSIVKICTLFFHPVVRCCLRELWIHTYKDGSNLHSPQSDLIGTWRMVIADDRPNNRETWVHSYGEHPRGYLIYDVSGLHRQPLSPIPPYALHS